MIFFRQSPQIRSKPVLHNPSTFLGDIDSVEIKQCSNSGKNKFQYVEPKKCQNECDSLISSSLRMTVGLHAKGLEEMAPGRSRAALAFAN